MGESDEGLTPAEAVREVVEAICLTNEVMPLGWILVVEGAPAEGGESLAMFVPAEQAVHRTLGQVAYAQQWFNQEAAQHWRQTDDQDDY